MAKVAAFNRIAKECLEETNFEPKNITDFLKVEEVLNRNDIGRILEKPMAASQLVTLFEIISGKRWSLIAKTVEVMEKYEHSVAEIMKRHLSQFEDFSAEVQGTNSADRESAAWMKVLDDPEAKTLFLAYVSVRSIQGFLWGRNVLSQYNLESLNAIIVISCSKDTCIGVYLVFGGQSGSASANFERKDKVVGSVVRCLSERVAASYCYQAKGYSR